MKTTIKFFLLFAGLSVFTQYRAQLTVHKMIYAGYEYQNQSFADVGGRLLFLTHDNVLYRVGAAALMGAVDSEFSVLPKVQADILFNFEKNVDFYHSWYFLAGAEVTNKFIVPKLGISVFGIADVTAGYGFSLEERGNKGKKFKGLNMGVTINIPIVVFSH